MEMFKLNNRRKKAKAALLTAQAEYEAVKAELRDRKAPIQKILDEIMPE